MVETVGAFVIAVSVAIFLWNIWSSRLRGHRSGIAAGADPWDARSLEWMVPSPTPSHNFDAVPVVTHLDEFWHRKYGEDDRGRPVRIAPTEDVVQKGDPTGIHLPSPSYWPIVLAAGLPLIGYGIIFNLGFAAVGTFVVFLAIYGLGLEPTTDPDAGHDDADHGHDGGDDHDGAEAAIDAPADEQAEQPVEEQADEAAEVPS
jgi:cytochrome c oxidase subunit 1